MGIGRFQRLPVDNITENGKLSVISSSFPAQIKRCRAYLRLTQKGLADKIEVSISTIRAWEQGKQFPSFENYEKVYALVKGTPIAIDLEKSYLEEKGQ